MSDLVGTPKDMLSQNAAHKMFQNESDVQNGLILDDFENAPRNWLIPAICSAVFFFPTGVIAVRNAIRVIELLLNS